MIKRRIWSGFDSEDDIYQLIEDVLDEDADENLLRNAVPQEFQLKRQAEATWPTTTDCDRLDDAFAELNDDGVVALRDAGTTISDGHEDVNEALLERDESGVSGYCFYHGQDIERAVNGGGLPVAFGDFHENTEQKKAVGEQIKACLERHGLKVEWNGDPERRLLIPKFDWKRRGQPE